MIGGTLGPQKLCPGHDSAAGRFKRLGQLKPRPAHAGQDVVKVGRRGASPAGHLGDGLATGDNSVLDAHVEKCNSEMLPKPAFFANCALLPSSHHGAMPWLRVSNFKKRLKEFQASTGKTQTEAAEALGTTYGTLKFWLSGTRPPKVETLQRLASVFGCSITEFIDDPGQMIAGTMAGHLSERRRLWASLINETFSADEFNDEDAAQLYEDFLQSVSRLRNMKARLR